MKNMQMYQLLKDRGSNMHSDDSISLHENIERISY